MLKRKKLLLFNKEENFPPVPPVQVDYYQDRIGNFYYTRTATHYTTRASVLKGVKHEKWTDNWWKKIN